MNSNPKIPEKILKNYFILQDEIKSVSRFSPLEAFNKKIFDEECSLNHSAKKVFYLCSGLSIGLLLPALNFAIQSVEQFQLLRQLENLNAEEKLRDLTWRFAALLSGLFLSSAIFLGYKAYRAFNAFKGDEKSRLLKSSHHPGVAKQIYEAVEVILAERIPIYTVYNDLAHEFPVHSMLGTRKNAMLVLLGDETHRQSLWKDGHVPKGPILVHKKYNDKVLGALTQSIRKFDEMTKDERDPRYLVTALLNQKHMEDCLAVTLSDGFWKEKRKSKKRLIILSLTEVLLKNWGIWENFRNNITGNFTKATYKDSEFHDFVEELLENSGATKTEIIDILSGEDRTSREFFRSLKAIKEQDLVARDTQVK